jgi:hypothetical protein
MPGRERDGAPHPPPGYDELEEKISRLTEDQRNLYNAQIHISVERNGEASREYRTDLAGTLLKNFPPHIEAQQVRDLNRREDARIHQSQDLAAPEPQRPEFSPRRIEVPAPGLPGGIQGWRAPAGSHRPAANTENASSDPMQGVEPHAPPRDYSQLNLAHEQIARQLRAGPNARQPQASAPELLSVQELHSMSQRFAEVRRDVNIVPDRGEMLQKADLARAHEIDRQLTAQKFEQSPGDPKHEQARSLMQHQHLAERVGVEAKWIARHLKAAGLPDADKFQKDATRAFATAHARSAGRENLRPGADRDDQQRSGAEAFEAQKQYSEREAAQGGRTQSAESRGNTPGAAVKEVTAQREFRSPGRSPGSGGRGR